MKRGGITTPMLTMNEMEWYLKYWGQEPQPPDPDDPRPYEHQLYEQVIIEFCGNPPEPDNITMDEVHHAELTIKTWYHIHHTGKPQFIIWYCENCDQQTQHTLEVKPFTPVTRGYRFTNRTVCQTCSYTTDS